MRVSRTSERCSSIRSVGTSPAPSRPTRCGPLRAPPADARSLEAAGGAVRFAVARANPAAIVGLFIASLALAALVGAAFGWLTSYPALRLRGDFLAIVLIAVGEASRVFFLNYEPI